MKLEFYLKKLIAIVLIIAMTFSTGGFASLADSISQVVNESKSETVSQKELSHKYYDELQNELESLNESSVGSSDDSVWGGRQITIPMKFCLARMMALLTFAVR